MDISLFLAKLLGLYFLIVGGMMLLRREDFHAIYEEIRGSRMHQLIAAIIALIIGLILVTLHNIWIMSWPVVITIIGWLAVLKGMAYLYWPEGIYHTIRWMQNNSVYYSMVILIILLGVFLMYQGIGV